MSDLCPDENDLHQLYIKLLMGDLPSHSDALNGEAQALICGATETAAMFRELATALERAEQLCTEELYERARLLWAGKDNGTSAEKVRANLGEPAPAPERGPA